MLCIECIGQHRRRLPPIKIGAPVKAEERVVEARVEVKAGVGWVEAAGAGVKEEAARVGRRRRQQGWGWRWR